MLDFLKLFLFNQFFPPARNNFIAHEAKEQVRIGRLGT